MKAPLWISIPHCGETVPPEAVWLNGVDEKVLLLDVDRFVDQIYAPWISADQVPAVFAQVHRYAVDLNRYPEDIDGASVQGAKALAGKFTSGFHWVKSTQGHVLIASPLSQDLHSKLVRQFHDPFHAQIAAIQSQVRSRYPGQDIYHLDLHSMPSQGTEAHSDQGRKRPDVVVSDYNGQSASTRFRDLVLESFTRQGFETVLNWPYQGGRITQRYGQPAQNHHTIQIELNRKLYMDEDTRHKRSEFAEFSKKVCVAGSEILSQVARWTK